jgi:hypothetical protein
VHSSANQSFLHIQTWAHTTSSLRGRICDIAVHLSLLFMQPSCSIPNMKGLGGARVFTSHEDMLTYITVYAAQQPLQTQLQVPAREQGCKQPSCRESPLRQPTLQRLHPAALQLLRQGRCHSFSLQNTAK